MLGKHSGSQGVRQAYEALGITLAEAQLGPLLSRIREYATLRKQGPGSADLQRFLAEISAGVEWAVQ